MARRAVKGLVSNLEESGSNILGIVLNDLPGKKAQATTILDTTDMDTDTIGINITTSIMVRRKMEKLDNGLKIILYKFSIRDMANFDISSYF